MKRITSAEAKELNQNFIKTRGKALDKRRNDIIFCADTEKEAIEILNKKMISNCKLFRIEENFKIFLRSNFYVVLLFGYHVSIVFKFTCMNNISGRGLEPQTIWNFSFQLRGSEDSFISTFEPGHFLFSKSQ